MSREGTDTDEQAARATLQDLDPERCIAWVAMAGDRPVGLSTVLLRTIVAGPRTYRAGYWCALYIDPEFRQTMLYPLLPRAMHRALEAAGLDFVYANVRIPWLVDAHRRIGLEKLGDTPVLVKPLSPVALLVRHRKLAGALELAGRPIDGAVRVYRRLRWALALAGCSVEELPWESPRVAEVAELWRRASSGRVGQPWTLESLRRRYGGAGSARYSLLGVSRGGRVVAAAVYRAVARERLLLGALMDVVGDGDGEGLGRAIAAVEREADSRGCHAMLTIDGPGVLPRGALRNAGFLTSRENYQFLIWPCGKLGPDSPLRDFARWRYALGDHDAF